MTKRDPPAHERVTNSQMTDHTSSLELAFREFDRINADDPRREVVDGKERPKELVYALRMSETLASFEPDASEALRLAVRSQHIARWRIPRSRFPDGRAGYKKWRAMLQQKHAALASDVLRQVGYGDDTIERVVRLLKKQGIKRDAEVQALEDVACLVFLRYYFDDFGRQHDDDKLVDILRKTWVKMSEKGQQAALKLDLGERATRLLRRALSGAGS